MAEVNLVLKAPEGFEFDTQCELDFSPVFVPSANSTGIGGLSLSDAGNSTAFTEEMLLSDRMLRT